MATAATETTTTDIAKKRAARRRKKTAGRKKRAARIQTDKEYAKALFAGRSKRSTDKKSAFRKKKTKKK